jgi:hypothetical protein
VTFTSLIRFAPVYDPYVALGPVVGGGSMYERGAFRTLDREVPVVVDHSLDRKLGFVREIAVIDDVDGTWFAGLATLDDAPAWLKPGTRASFEFKSLHRRELNGWDCVVRAILTEVSVLHSLKPVEPRAKVLTLHRRKPKSSAAAAKPTPKRQAAGAGHIQREEVLLTEDPYMHEVQRRIEWAERRSGRRADMEAILKHMQREEQGLTIDEIYAETIVRRQGRGGQVLGVR